VIDLQSDQDAPSSRSGAVNMSLSDPSQKTKARLTIELKAVREKSKPVSHAVSDKTAFAEPADVVYPQLRYLSGFLEEAHDVHYRYSFVEGRFLHLSSSIEDMTGYTTTEALERPEAFSRRAIHPEDRANVTRAIREHLSAGPIDKPLVLQCRLVCADRRVILVRLAMEYEWNSEGPIEVYGAIRNITERKQAEEALRESEEEYRKTINSMQDAIQVVDADMRIVLVNSHYIRWNENLGIETDVLGKKVFEVYPFLPERVRKEYEHVISTGEVLITEETTTIGDREIVTETRKLPIEKNGKVDRVVTVIHDITDRTLVEEELRRHRDHLEDLVQERAAQIIETNEQLRQEITERKRSEKIRSVMSRISEATTTSEDLTDLLQTIHRLLGRLMDTTNFYVCLYDETDDSYSFPYTVDEYDNQATITQEELRRSLTNYVRRTGLPFLADRESYERLQRDGVAEMIGTPSLIWLGAPLRTSHGVIGVVAVHSYIDGQLYSEEDLQVLTLASGHIATAIERKKAVDALLRSEERYRNLIASMNEGFALTDKNEMIIFANDKFANILGHEKAMDVMGRNLGEFTSAEQMQMFESETKKRCTGAESHYEAVLVRPDGEERIVSISAKPVFDDAGMFVGTLGLTFDITERKRAEEALKESEERYRNLYKNATVGLMTTTIDDGKILICNETMARIAGYDSPEDFVSRGSILDNYAETTRRDEFLEVLRRDGRVDDFEIEGVRKDGSHYWVLVSSRIFPELNRIESCEVDITDRKVAEQEREEAQEDLKRFVYIVSHDLRTPLINMRGFARELRRSQNTIRSTVDKALPQLEENERTDLVRAFEEDVPEALDFLDYSATHMDRMISGILRLSRLGHRTLTFEPADMNEIIDRTLKALSYQIEQNGIQVTQRQLPEIVADVSSMELVIENLVGNAVTYLDPERPGRIEIWGEKSPRWTTYHVKDNGRGIAGPDVPKIYDLFVRAGDQTVKGEGMGLAYVKSVIQRHDGRIWCVSELDVGTTFSFAIPTLPITDTVDGKL
jgi:PAS domain S-box-containing protein